MQSPYLTHGQARQFLLPLLLASLAAVTWPLPLAGQEEGLLRISRLRGELSDLYELDPRELQLHVPPLAAIAPGAIVCLDGPRGLEIIDRLPDVAIDEQAPAGDAADRELRDLAETREDSLLLKQLFGDEAVLPLGTGVQIGVRNIRRRSLTEQDPARLAERVLRS
jgi:hypothetical protein